MFDLWGGRYGESAEALRQAFRYGLTDAMVVWHNWQRWGYDYRLPDIYPPNPQLGTLEEMQELIDACKRGRRAVRPARQLHRLLSRRRRLLLREEHRLPPTTARRSRPGSTRAATPSSYRYRADAIEPFLRRNLRADPRRTWRPTAYFIDVWSSIRPYDYWTADGRFFDRVYTRDTWGEHFAWIRELLGDDAPQISESGHDQLIGWLDGAQTNHLRVGQPVAEATLRLVRVELEVRRRRADALVRRRPSRPLHPARGRLLGRATQGGLDAPAARHLQRRLHRHRGAHRPPGHGPPALRPRRGPQVLAHRPT